MAQLARKHKKQRTKYNSSSGAGDPSAVSAPEEESIEHADTPAEYTDNVIPFMLLWFVTPIVLAIIIHFVTGH